MVDQFRGDYVDKLQAQWSSGLRRLVTQGAWFRQADYPYFNTVTCAGHASVSTGAVPSAHGMILNGWWDREAQRPVTCTEDDRVTAISYGKPVAAGGESAARLRAATLADELRAQLSPPGRTIAFLAEGTCGSDARRPASRRGRLVRRQRIVGDFDGLLEGAGPGGRRLHRASPG